MVWPFYTPDDTVKSQRDDHPYKATAPRCGHAQFTAAYAESEQVDSDGDEYANVKGDPEPNARRHAGQGFMPRAVRQSQIARRADGTYTSQGQISPHQWMLN